MINTGLLDKTEIESTVRVALAEDIGDGDLTAELVSNAGTAAHLICRDHAIICGRPWVDKCFELFDSEVSLEWLIDDGQVANASDLVCRIEGASRSILTVERSALNFLQTLSAVATTTRQYVDAVAGTGCRILDTRKTLPGLRKAQKYAVSCGGGHNHRIGLYDAILIKENHIAAAGSVCEALSRAQASAGSATMIEVEVENLMQLQEALDCGARRVLLDNFAQADLKQAVDMARGRAETEVSGNVTLGNVREIANYGIDYVSIGALTKNIHAIDLSLLFTR